MLFVNPINQRQNWSGGVRFKPQSIHYPRSEAELIAHVTQARCEEQTLRLVGAGHSFPPLIQTPHHLVSLDRWQGIESVDISRMTAWVKAGTRLYNLNAELHKLGLALANLGDIDRQSIAGAVSTATHGTGLSLGNVSTQVTGLRLLCADGQIHRLDAQHPWFKAACVSLGALGIITAVELKVQPAYRLKLELRKAKLSEVLDDLDALLATHRHVEFFVFPGSEYVQLKLTNQSDEAPSARWQQHLNDLLLENMAFWGLSEISRRVPGATSKVAQLCGAAISNQVQVDDSHKIFANKRWTRFEEMEYNVPLGAFRTCLEGVLALIQEENLPVHFPIECRFVAADENWLSPSYQRPGAYLAVHQYRGMPWRYYFRMAEWIFKSHDGRPHWGKQHFLKYADFEQLYPRWADFQALRSELDPQHIFLNDYLRPIMRP